MGTQEERLNRISDTLQHVDSTTGLSLELEIVVEREVYEEFGDNGEFGNQDSLASYRADTPTLQELDDLDSLRLNMSARIL